jgi:tRNA nucleotidyltransferase/poly(A) polymerase
MALSDDGYLTDLFGGQEDIKSKILRTPLHPKITMMDDPLRFIRALRFSITLGFSIHPDIIDCIDTDVLEKLKLVVSSERITAELTKMMKADSPRSIRLLCDLDQKIPGLFDSLFTDNLWFFPTNRNK